MNTAHATLDPTPTTPTPFTLFHLSGCPYCHRVLRAADRLGLELRLVEITEDREALQHLLAKRGRATVPVLHIPGPDGSMDWRQGGTLLAESRDIVGFLTTWANSRQQAA